MTDNLNLAKFLLRDTCKGVYFLLKMNSSKAIFQNIALYISNILSTILKILPFSNNTYYKEHLLLAVSSFD